MAGLEHVKRMEDTFDTVVMYTLQAVEKADLVLKEPQENAMIAECFSGKSICSKALPFLFGTFL